MLYKCEEKKQPRGKLEDNKIRFISSQNELGKH